jgi:hypothetical protein
VLRTKVSGVVPPDPTGDGERGERRVGVAQIALVITILIVGQPMDWRTRWSPDSTQSAEALSCGGGCAGWWAAELGPNLQPVKPVRAGPSPVR